MIKSTLKFFFQSAWVACFSVAAVAVLLQGVPVVNFFLSFFGPQYWSIIFVNLGFIFMALKGFQSDEARLLKIIPAIWFAGYLALAAASHLLAGHFYREIDKQNAAQKIEWDRRTDQIALSHDWTDENLAVTFTPRDLIWNYDINSAYSGQPDNGLYGKIELRRQTCPRGQMNDGPEGVQALRHNGDRTEFAENLCVITSRGYLPSNGINIVNKGIKNTDLVLDRRVEQIEVTTGKGRKFNLQAGWTGPLSWFPAPIIGCDWPGFNASPAWCGIRFMRKSFRENARTPEKVITEALDLKKSTVEDRFPGTRWK